MNFEHKHINPNRFTDSAGISWQGREFDTNQWSNDDGTAPAEFLKVITAFRVGEASQEQVIAVVANMRLLIPLLADLGESETGAHGKTVDKSAELSVVTVATPDDQNGLPVFSSVEAMQRWNKSARPVPANARRVALAAASESNTRVIIDAESETEFAIRRPAIEAIAKEQQWVHPIRDQRVIDEFRSVESQIAEIESLTLQDGDETSRLRSAEVLVLVELIPGLNAQQLQEVMQRFAQVLSQSSVIAEHVDSLRVKLN